MTCLKTGCHVWVEPYGEYAWGDAFRLEATLPDDKTIWRELHNYKLTERIQDLFYFRISGTSFDPINGLDHIHGVIHSYDNWFKDKPYGTLISNHVTWATVPCPYIRSPSP